jgi:hypothetical protein
LRGGLNVAVCGGMLRKITASARHFS